LSDFTGRGIDVCLSRAFILVWFLVVPASAAAEVVRVAMPTEGFLYMPLYIAVDGGFMKEQGIDADLVQFRGGGAAIAGLASGSVDICACAIQNAVNASARGAGVKLIGTLIGQYASNVVLRADVAKRLGITGQTPMQQRLASLKGLKIAVSGAGSSTDFLIRYLARRAGLAPERDLTVLFMGGGGPILAAFSQGRIDGFVLSSPTSDMALLKYNGVLLIDMSRGEFEELRGYPSITVSAKTTWLKANAGLARRFLQALARANRMIREQPTVAKQVVRKRFGGVADDVYEAAWTANLAAYPLTPRVEDVSVKRAITFLGTVQGAKIPGTSTEYFDNTFADAALRTAK
jgi:NitT/TauT family transport system substrate-binding protein